VVRALEKMGFEAVRQRGSHVILKRIGPDGTVGCVVPLHRQLARGTLQSIVRQAKITIEELNANL
jgi:predicted RNA binding protein YcfA (HicA-like mRNA interferase family)